jgi:A/G-specific adenine glycosylase
VTVRSKKKACTSKSLQSNNFFAEKLLSWFKTHQRELPFRKDKNPYKIWLSEIIMQQTRMAQGIPYYERFIETFPEVKSLAESDIEKILKLWQGLGYYSRAHNLHAAARQIVKDHNSSFPDQYEELIKLKGVGEYTAAAIASIAFGKPVAVIDGNVYRVLARYFGIELPIDSNEGKKYFKQLANDLLDKKYPGEYNEAIMEFGAVQCLPKNPNCKECPLQTTCHSFLNQCADQFPIKAKKTPVKNHFLYYFLILNHDGEIMVKQRDNTGIWKNLFEFPVLESQTEIPIKNLPSFLKKSLDIPSELKLSQRTIFTQKHQLSHRNIYASFIKIEPKLSLQFLPQGNRWVKTSEFHGLPVSKLMQNFWESSIWNKKK